MKLHTHLYIGATKQNPKTSGLQQYPIALFGTQKELQKGKRKVKQDKTD